MFKKPKKFEITVRYGGPDFEWLVMKRSQLDQLLDYLDKKKVYISVQVDATHETFTPKGFTKGGK